MGLGPAVPLGGSPEGARAFTCLVHGAPPLSVDRVGLDR
jgi:hypothetical protein